MMEGTDFTEDLTAQKWPGTRHWRGSAGYFGRISVFYYRSTYIIYGFIFA
jgi:hypothetical protein